MAKMHHEQQYSQVDLSKLEQPNNNIGGQQDLYKQQQRGFGNVGGGFNNDGGNFNHRGRGGGVGERDRRDDGNFGAGRQSLRAQFDTGVNSWREEFHGNRNSQGEQFQRIENRNQNDRFQNPGARGDYPEIGNPDDQFHGQEDQFHRNQNGQFNAIGNQNGQFNGIRNQNGQFNGIGNQNAQFNGLGNGDGRFPNQDSQLHGAAKESFNDFRITDEQKKSVFDSLQGKLARGEKLDDRQLKILQHLSKYFQIGEHKSHNVVEDKNKVPIRNGMDLEDLHHEQHKEIVDHEERDGLEGNIPKKEDQLPNPLDENEEVKDLIEGQQKPGEFENLGNERKFEVVDREREREGEEPVGAGGEELKQVALPIKEEDRKEPDFDERELHKDEHFEEVEKKGNGREGDNPLPRPAQNDVNLDDEDDYPGAKKDKEEVLVYVLYKFRLG